MTEETQAFCHICKHFHPAHSVGEEEVKIIAEDAQCPADYYLMAEHLNSQTGERCEGSGKVPESLAVEEDWDAGYLIGDEEPPEEYEPEDWCGPDASAYAEHYRQRHR